MFLFSKHIFKVDLISSQQLRPTTLLVSVRVQNFLKLAQFQRHYRGRQKSKAPLVPGIYKRINQLAEHKPVILVKKFLIW